MGCLVHVDDSTAFETWDGEMVNASITFNVDGQVVKCISETGGVRGGTVLAIPKEEELFPTLTLHSADTKVLCRFCSADIIATKRSEIGLPANATDNVVFTLDGSVLFDYGQTESTNAGAAGSAGGASDQGASGGSTSESSAASASRAPRRRREATM